MSPTNATNIHIGLVLEDIQQLKDKITKTVLINVINERLKRNAKTRMV